MSNLLDGIPSQSQRQDSAIAQLYDLVRVANRLGMHDAADAMRQAFDLGKFDSIRYGCHCDENSTCEIYDDCVLNGGRIEDCSMAAPGMRPEQCEYWRPITGE